MCICIYNWYVFVGLDEEGLYRRPGVLARANKLLKEITGISDFDLLLIYACRQSLLSFGYHRSTLCIIILYLFML